MIPKLSTAGVLPPFLPTSSPSDRSSVAPYIVSIANLIDRYAFNDKRKKILSGLLNYRRILKNSGIIDGFQWIDGSFTEDVETIKSREPSDIDIITFAHRPKDHVDRDAWEKFVTDNPMLFNPGATKHNFLCDAYYVDLNTHPEYLVKNVSYWYGLFSHQRATFLWKGMLEISLDQSEDGYNDILSQEDSDGK